MGSLYWKEGKEVPDTVQQMLAVLGIDAVRNILLNPKGMRVSIRID